MGPEKGSKLHSSERKSCSLLNDDTTSAPIKTMSLSENVCPPLAARAATDPSAARLLEMFAKADELLSERSAKKKAR
jgi:hypothetical protein